MFNEYTVFQMMKLRQEEIERNASEAWKFYANPSEKEKSETLITQSNTPLSPCCQCAQLINQLFLNNKFFRRTRLCINNYLRTFWRTCYGDDYQFCWCKFARSHSFKIHLKKTACSYFCFISLCHVHYLRLYFLPCIKVRSQNMKRSVTFFSE